MSKGLPSLEKMVNVGSVNFAGKENRHVLVALGYSLEEKKIIPLLKSYYKVLHYILWSYYHQLYLPFLIGTTIHFQLDAY